MSASNTQNLTVWMDIAVADLDRAIAFYSAVTARMVEKECYKEQEFAVFSHEGGNGACLIHSPEEIARNPGILVYFNVNGRLQDAVKKVIEMGGQVNTDIHPIGPHGFRAIIIDSEGNKIALHSETNE